MKEKPTWIVAPHSGWRCIIIFFQYPGGGGVGSEIEGRAMRKKETAWWPKSKPSGTIPALCAGILRMSQQAKICRRKSWRRFTGPSKENDPWASCFNSFSMLLFFFQEICRLPRHCDGWSLPIPDGRYPGCGDIAGQLRQNLSGKSQSGWLHTAFGGGEWWGREPTIQEVRTMTYQAIIKGARGIQYFVRQGFNLFPKSTATWGECGRMAVEICRDDTLASFRWRDNSGSVRFTEYTGFFRNA